MEGRGEVPISRVYDDEHPEKTKIDSHRGERPDPAPLPAPVSDKPNVREPTGVFEGYLRKKVSENTTIMANRKHKRYYVLNLDVLKLIQYEFSNQKGKTTGKIYPGTNFNRILIDPPGK